ncbi:MAG: variant-type mycofactocin precursor [Deltaproteobacteria bacterium]|nr:variant-type mycofactocin precursor [Deltaproteobacteria bacterium]
MEKELETRENEKEGDPCVLEVVNVEELAVDGICGIY